MYMNKNLAKAKRHLIKSGYTCVLVRDEQIYTSMERGVKPLLEWFDKGLDLQDFSAADKVVGNGAAMLYVLLGVKELYTPIISKAARQTLQSYEIQVKYDWCVEEIRNRMNTGICPIEAVVEGIANPKEALKAIRKKFTELAK